jgi:hypothetical protein
MKQTPVDCTHCTRTNRVNLTFISTAAVARDMVSLSDAVEGQGSHQGIRYISMHQPACGIYVMATLNKLWNGNDHMLSTVRLF